MCFLLHLDGISLMILPLYFHKSLTKMVAKAQKSSNIQHEIYHQTLIKLIIFQKLCNFNHGWEQFLLSYEFVTPETLPTPPDTFNASSIKKNSIELCDVVVEVEVLPSNPMQKWKLKIKQRENERPS